MATFTTAELDYLSSERRLGRLATADANGLPHVVPVGMWRYNPELGTIDVTGRSFAASKKFRNVRVHPQAALVVDDLASVDPWRPRSVLVRGRAEALEAADGEEAIIRITPDKITSWGLANDG
jgi:pyridoxamine 5'-phosphate oxidase family protein